MLNQENDMVPAETLKWNSTLDVCLYIIMTQYYIYIFTYLCFDRISLDVPESAWAKGSSFKKKQVLLYISSQLTSAHIQSCVLHTSTFAHLYISHLDIGTYPDMHMFTSLSLSPAFSLGWCRRVTTKHNSLARNECQVSKADGESCDFKRSAATLREMRV